MTTLTKEELADRMGLTLEEFDEQVRERPQPNRAQRRAMARAGRRRGKGWTK